MNNFSALSDNLNSVNKELADSLIMYKMENSAPSGQVRAGACGCRCVDLSRPGGQPLPASLSSTSGQDTALRALWQAEWSEELSVEVHVWPLCVCLWLLTVPLWVGLSPV